MTTSDCLYAPFAKVDVGLSATHGSDPAADRRHQPRGPHARDHRNRNDILDSQDWSAWHRRLGAYGLDGRPPLPAPASEVRIGRTPGIFSTMR